MLIGIDEKLPTNDGKLAVFTLFWSILSYSWYIELNSSLFYWLLPYLRLQIPFVCRCHWATFSIVLVRVQLSQPYNRMDSTVAMKNRFFRSRLMLDFQIFFMSLRALHTCAFLKAMSLLDSLTKDPRYLKSSFCSNTAPSLVHSWSCASML